ncbi:hypothetical protein [Selenomonas ruminantium]|uniref:hypothetical protein n=1 Tax=Selenomonas ruminantium TaxID=971 RepID=UPI0026EFE521|nr:hypothetical protein [Selenomonas ruminantium]
MDKKCSDYHMSELSMVIQQARKLFPNEIIAYNLDGDMTIDEYIEYLKRRIMEAEDNIHKWS